MSERAAVLVLTEECDPTADLVVRELTGRNVPVFRCDAADFPRRLTLTAGYGGAGAGSLRLPERSVDLASVGSVYYRRPSDFVFPAELSDAVGWWAQGEARRGLGGVLQGLGCRWVSDPVAMARAEFKPLQLATAARVGLRVPATVVTNDPVQARKFVAGQTDGAVYKPLDGTPVADTAGRNGVLYTTPIVADQIDDSIALTAHLIQQRIKKAFEARVTVVGGRVFAARIDASSPAAREDFRADYDSVTYSRLELPDGVHDGAVALVHALGLSFGAVDFGVDEDGRYWFFEVNGNGQWAFVPHLREPITHAIADVLTGGMI